MPGGQGLARPARKLADLSDAQAAQHHPLAPPRIKAETLPAVSPRPRPAADQEHNLVPLQPPRGGQQCLAGSSIGPMQVLDHHGDRPGVLGCAQQRQQLHTCRERVTSADRRKPGQDAQRHITRQFVRLRPQDLTGRWQPGEDFGQQRGLPRPGRRLRSRPPGPGPRPQYERWPRPRQVRRRARRRPARSPARHPRLHHCPSPSTTVLGVSPRD